jgi:hypothetical protein
MAACCHPQPGLAASVRRIGDDGGAYFVELTHMVRLGELAPVPSGRESEATLEAACDTPGRHVGPARDRLLDGSDFDAALRGASLVHAKVRSSAHGGGRTAQLQGHVSARRSSPRHSYAGRERHGRVQPTRSGSRAPGGDGRHRNNNGSCNGYVQAVPCGGRALTALAESSGRGPSGLVV